ncbi:uncharacterized protein EAF01_003742 [Botrytis porri]|uniref:uncharacterized protein n=1 Tax=Botrytis porri TaxID=87229 RepID=UPI001902A33D|nr:uncharacterized protein EAF01_003742 [Botrytis porri]KAF7910024.1 hypothetical protein EAF01_003742 [Botrytis porri]
MAQNIETEASRNRNLLLTNEQEPRNLGLMDSKQITSPRTIMDRRGEKYKLSSEQDLVSRLMEDSNGGDKTKKMGSHPYGPDLRPLAMSKTKDDLLKHLNLDFETYALMANCKGKPPYDWCDILEQSKDHAIELIAQNATDQTAYYWSLARPTLDCPQLDCTMVPLPQVSAPR